MLKIISNFSLRLIFGCFNIFKCLQRFYADTAEMPTIPSFAELFPFSRLISAFISVPVYAVIISKYVTKIVGTQNRQVACIHGTQDQKQSTFKKLKPAQ